MGRANEVFDFESEEIDSFNSFDEREKKQHELVQILNSERVGRHFLFIPPPTNF
jgi:hypothetical protein